MGEIKFNAKYLVMLLPFIADNDVRYYLNGVHIEPAESEFGGVYLVATDGHRMLVIHDAEGECDSPVEFRVSRDVRRFCKKPRFGGEPFVEIDTGTQRLTIANKAGELYLQPGKCLIQTSDKMHYPDWRRVMPDFSKLSHGSPDTFNSRYVAETLKVAPTGGSFLTGYQPVRFWHEDGQSNGPMFVQFVLAPEAIAIIMSIKCDGEKFGNAIIAAGKTNQTGSDDGKRLQPTASV